MSPSITAPSAGTVAILLRFTKLYCDRNADTGPFDGKDEAGLTIAINGVAVTTPADRDGIAIGKDEEVALHLPAVPIPAAVAPTLADAAQITLVEYDQRPEWDDTFSHDHLDLTPPEGDGPSAERFLTFTEKGDGDEKLDGKYRLGYTVEAVRLASLANVAQPLLANVTIDAAAARIDRASAAIAEILAFQGGVDAAAAAVGPQLDKLHTLTGQVATLTADLTAARAAVATMSQTVTDQAKAVGANLPGWATTIAAATQLARSVPTPPSGTDPLGPIRALLDGLRTKTSLLEIAGAIDQLAPLVADAVKAHPDIPGVAQLETIHEQQGAPIEIPDLIGPTI